MNGRELKDRGIKQAIDNAESKHEGWADQAIEFIRKFDAEQFMAEDVRLFAYANGLPHPPHQRAWGGVIQAAQRLGIIRHAGYGHVKNPRAHQTPASIWEKVSST